MPEVVNASDGESFPVLVIGDSGGPHVRNRALAVANLGYEIHTVTSRLSGVAALNERATKAARFGNTPILRLLNDAFALFDLKRQIKKSPGDIVHIHYASSLGAWLFVASGDRRPLIVTVMGGDILFDEQSNPAATARWLTRQVLRRADYMTASSDRLAERAIALGAQKDRITTVVWGVDIDLFQPIEKPDCATASDPKVASPTIFSPRILRPFYRTDIIVKSMQIVLGRYPNARLIISEHECDAAFKKIIENIARDLGVSHAIEYAGNIPHDRMPQYYHRADIVVSVPPSEGFPISVLEAMACGVPNIVARLDCYREILVDRQSALFVEPTVEGVANGILEIFDDKSLSERMRRNGPEIVRTRADLANEAARVAKIYQNAHANGHGRRRPFAVRALAATILCGLIVRNLLLSPFRQKANLYESSSGPAFNGTSTSRT